MAPTTDRVLVALALAHEAGFRLPLYLAAAVHADCVAWTDDDTHRTGVPQDATGRLWDVVFMAAQAARRLGLAPVPFVVYRVPRTVLPEQVARAEDGDGELAEPVWLSLRRDGDTLVIDEPACRDCGQPLPADNRRAGIRTPYLFRRL